MWYFNDMFDYMFKAEFVTHVSLKVPSGCLAARKWWNKKNNKAINSTSFLSPQIGLTFLPVKKNIFVRSLYFCHHLIFFCRVCKDTLGFQLEITNRDTIPCRANDPISGKWEVKHIYFPLRVNAVAPSRNVFQRLPKLILELSVAGRHC